HPNRSRPDTQTSVCIILEVYAQNYKRASRIRSRLECLTVRGALCRGPGAPPLSGAQRVGASQAHAGDPVDAVRLQLERIERLVVLAVRPNQQDLLGDLGAAQPFRLAERIALRLL